MEISNFKSFRSSGRMPLKGQVSRFGGFASVALRKLAILDAAGCLNDLSLPPGNRLEPLRSAPLPFLAAQRGLLAADAVQP
jgi:plasmid maintenance system killer protein